MVITFNALKHSTKNENGPRLMMVEIKRGQSFSKPIVKTKNFALVKTNQEEKFLKYF